MLRLKWLFKWIFGMGLLVTLFFFGLSGLGRLLDEEPIVDLELVELPVVTDEENAYLPLAFIDATNYQVGELSDSSAVLLYESWDSNGALNLLDSHDRELNAVAAALARPAFATTMPEWDAPFTNFSALVAFSRLKIVESRLAAEHGDLDSALQSWSDGIEFARLVKNDGFAILIAYMVGLAMLEEQLT